nr:autotransporter outer membrane beta-barrel domain-containing protein [Dyella soli]
MALAGCFSSAQARDLAGPGRVFDIRQGDASESWRVFDHARLRAQPGARMNSVAVRGAYLEMTGARLEHSINSYALAIENESVATLVNSDVISDSGMAIAVGTGAGMGPDGGLSSQLVAVDSRIEGVQRGVNILRNSSATFQGTSVVGRCHRGTCSEGYAAVISSGTLNAFSGSHLRGDRAGVWVVEDVRGYDSDGTFVNLDRSKVEGGSEAAIVVNDFAVDYTRSHPVITIRNGSELLSQTGVLVKVGKYSTADIRVHDSALSGDLVTDESSSIKLGLFGDASLSGRLLGNVSLAMADRSQWHPSGDVTLQSFALDGGTVGLGAGTAGTHASLYVAGDVVGRGGVIRLHSRLNEGGDVGTQFTDRVLVGGDVTTLGTVWLDVNGIGAGANTDRNGNGKVDAFEGMSLVQVGGASRRDAFALAGGYVAAGPWQYTLHAFGPGEVDASQNVLPVGSLQWDYRLASRLLDDGGKDPEPPVVDPPVIDPPVIDPPAVRKGLVPQAPSYLVAPLALLGYDDAVNDGLMQRLGDVRQPRLRKGHEGEVFARVVTGQQHYTTDLGFQDFGFDFRQQVNVLQLGAGLVTSELGSATLRAGWAADRGTSRVTPRAADGASQAKYTVDGASVWMTLTGDAPWYVDAVVRGSRFRGDVGTAARGTDVARVRGSGWSTSVEAGYRFALADAWAVEPHARLKRASQSFDDVHDVDDVITKVSRIRQTQLRMGATVSRQQAARFTPYARVELIGSFSGRANASIGSASWNVSDDFRVGRLGNAYRVASGATADLGRRVQVYGEATYQHHLGRYGVRSWSGHAGVRVRF